jgi:hypothetical protein
LCDQARRAEKTRNQSLEETIQLREEAQTRESIAEVILAALVEGFPKPGRGLKEELKCDHS